MRRSARRARLPYAKLQSSRERTGKDEKIDTLRPVPTAALPRSPSRYARRNHRARSATPGGCMDERVYGISPPRPTPCPVLPKRRHRFVDEGSTRESEGDPQRGRKDSGVF